MASEASPAPRTIGVPLPVNGSSGPVDAAEAVEPVERLDRLVERDGATETGSGASMVSADPISTGPAVVGGVAGLVVDVVELVVEVDVEVEVEVEVVEVDVDVVVALGRIPVVDGGTTGLTGAAPAVAGRPSTRPRSAAANSVELTVAVRRNECRSTTDVPPGCESAQERRIVGPSLKRRRP
jgi:hypothetical protein